MTEKQYGGSTGRGKERIINRSDSHKSTEVLTNKNKIKDSSANISSSEFSSSEQKIIKAGRIAGEVKKYTATIVKPGILLIEIAEKIESKIMELGGKPAFPVNLSINNIAAHYTPSHDDKTPAQGLLKVDFGVHVDGWTADNALSFDLENSEENKKLIKSSQEALDKALNLVKSRVEVKNEVSTDEIGSIISETVESFGFSPVINLSGHSMNQYELHAGTTIPNINDGRNVKLKDGLYAIEPFATNGSGRIHEGKPSGIYELKSEKNVRSPIAREVLELIMKEYNTLPFCSRWIVGKLGTKALFGLKQLEDNGNLHHFTQLIEIPDSKVSQAEQTILISKEGKVIVTTL